MSKCDTLIIQDLHQMGSAPLRNLVTKYFHCIKLCGSNFSPFKKGQVSTRLAHVRFKRKVVIQGLWTVGLQPRPLRVECMVHRYFCSYPSITVIHYDLSMTFIL